MTTHIQGYTFEVDECAELCFHLIKRFGYDQTREARNKIELMQKTINYLQKRKDKLESLQGS